MQALGLDVQPDAANPHRSRAGWRRPYFQQDALGPSAVMGEGNQGAAAHQCPGRGIDTKPNFHTARVPAAWKNFRTCLARMDMIEGALAGIL
jgi:hypothetical protein